LCILELSRLTRVEKAVKNKTIYSCVLTAFSIRVSLLRVSSQNLSKRVK